MPFTMGVRRNFSRGWGKSTFCLSSSGCWRCSANRHSQNASLFLYNKANAHCYCNTCMQWFPSEKIYTKQMFVFVSMDILRPVSRVPNELQSLWNIGISIKILSKYEQNACVMGTASLALLFFQCFGMFKVRGMRFHCANSLVVQRSCIL